MHSSAVAKKLREEYMLAHVRVAWATDLRHLAHLLQPEYASLLRFSPILPLYAAFYADY